MAIANSATQQLANVHQQYKAIHLEFWSPVVQFAGCPFQNSSRLAPINLSVKNSIRQREQPDRQSCSVLSTFFPGMRLIIQVYRSILTLSPRGLYSPLTTTIYYLLSTIPLLLFAIGKVIGVLDNCLIRNQ